MGDGPHAPAALHCPAKVKEGNTSEAALLISDDVLYDVTPSRGVPTGPTALSETAIAQMGLGSP